MPTSAVVSMLGAIKNMKIFLHTGFGDSASFVGGGISIKTQGLCQGNGASPAGWAVISICTLKGHGRKGHGVKFFCPITQLRHHLSAILYVDDTNLLHIDLTQNESMDKVHMAIQDSINSWGNLLIATGGVLNLQNASTLSSLLNGPMGCGIMRRMLYKENSASLYPSWVAYTPPGWQQSKDQPQASQPCREDAGSNDFAGRQQQFSHQHDAGEGTTVD